MNGAVGPNAVYGGAVSRPSVDPVSDEGPRPSARGERRRESLVQAGVTLLGEHGWASLTGRAVAERASAPRGLVHYHFGGQQALKRAVAAAAVADAFEPVVVVLTEHDTWASGIAAVARISQDMTASQGRVIAELIAASIHDPEVGTILRNALEQVRGRLLPWLTDMGAPEPEGLATLITALLDGLVLHRMIDPQLRLGRAAEAAILNF